MCLILLCCSGWQNTAHDFGVRIKIKLCCIALQYVLSLVSDCCPDAWCATGHWTLTPECQS